MSELLLTAESIELTPVDVPRLDSNEDSNMSSLDLLLDNKTKFNEDPNFSDVLVDPCEIRLDLIKKNCPQKAEDSSLCTLGVVLNEGVPHCPLMPERQLTLRSTFGSVDSQATNLK